MIGSQEHLEVTTLELMTSRWPLMETLMEILTRTLPNELRETIASS